MMKFYKLPEEREGLENELKDKIKRYQREVEENWEALVAEANCRFIHQKCKSPDTEGSVSFSILAPDGDEEVCLLLFCKECKEYFLDCYHDVFISDDKHKDFTYQREITGMEARIVKDVASKCKESYNKNCLCKYRREAGEILYKGFKGFYRAS